MERMLKVFSLYNLGKSLNFSFHMDSLLSEAERSILASLGIHDFSILLLDEEKETLTLWKANGATFKATKEVSFRKGEGICGLVAQSGEPVLIQDVSKDKRFLHYKGKKTDIGSFYSVPLKKKNNIVMGVLNIHKSKTNDLNPNDTILFDETALQISQALENSLNFQKSQKLAMTDELTQLHSRRYFMDALEKEISKAKRNHSVFSLIMIDVDNFKSINDTFGHSIGDNVLKNLACIFNSTTRRGDITARHGGEEFIILAPGTTEEDAINIAEKIRVKAEKDLIIEGTNERPPEVITISAGVCSYPESGQTQSELLTNVDNCLYASKNAGRNKVSASTQKKLPESYEGQRHYKRYQVYIKFCRGTNMVRSIELNFNGQWRMCMLDNISKRGFKGFVEFAPPEKGGELQFRVFFGIESVSHLEFSGLVAYKSNIMDGRYSVGIEIPNGHKKWGDFYNRIFH